MIIIPHQRSHVCGGISHRHRHGAGPRSPRTQLPAFRLSLARPMSWQPPHPLRGECAATSCCQPSQNQILRHRQPLTEVL